MEWAAALVTFFKGTQALRDIFEKAVVIYYAEEDRRDQNQSAEVAQKRDALVDALNQPGLKDETRRTLRHQLIALNRL